MRKNISILIVLAVFAAGGSAVAQHVHETFPEAKKEAAVSKKPLYYCPMHPAYTSDRPGDCPICNMKLVKREAPAPQKVSEGVFISSEKQQYIGMKTEAVSKRPLVQEISTVGRVAYDPKLYQAQVEYLSALKVKEQAPSLPEASRKKLLLLGMNVGEITALENEGAAQENLYLPQDTGTVWVYATVFENDIHFISEGLGADITAVAYPGEVFKGRVVSLKPVLDVATRSLEARIEVEDPEHKLKPEMFVDAVIQVERGEKMAVPEEAVVDTGERKVVFIARPEGHFVSRDVALGHKAGGYYEVLGGLSEGDLVVTSGNFFVDSESRLKAAFSDTSHQHGQ